MNNLENTTTLVLLAGGKSSRMGTQKGLLKHQNSFWLLLQIETYIGTEVIIGLGYESQLYFNAIPWLKNAVKTAINYKGKKVRVVINPSPELGLFSNLQSTLRHINPDQQILILPIDVPLLNTKGQKKLITKENIIVIPKYQGKKGHPVKMSSEYWPSFLNINLNDDNARLDYQIKKNNPSKISLIEASDRLCILNLNTPKDWQAYISS